MCLKKRTEFMQRLSEFNSCPPVELFVNIRVHHLVLELDVSRFVDQPPVLLIENFFPNLAIGVKHS